MIKFLVMDVDGTLTDGKIYMGNDGEVFKVFNIKDGCGIYDILPQFDIIPVVITARNSKIVHRRCEELKIKEIHQGCRDKIKKLNEILVNYSKTQREEYNFSNCAYIGDDLLDIPCMEQIKHAGGIVGCPSDAVDEVKEIADFISQFRGGSGAVREYIDYLSQKFLF